MAVNKANCKDVIFCGFDFQAVICYWFSKLTLRKRNIVAINVMLKFNETSKGKLYQYLYRIALASDNFYASVTSKDYGDYLNKKLGLNKDFTVIHDAVLERHKIKDSENIQVENNSVFMGGTSSRDWDFAYEVAAKMPQTRFRFVMDGRMYEKYRDRNAANVVLKKDIPYGEFNYLLYSSTLVMMPVNTEAPAGLIVLFCAAVNDKFYITTNTAANREYITSERGCILERNVDSWVKWIDYYVQHSKERQNKAENLHRWIESECSGEKYIVGMKKIADKIAVR